MKYKVHLLIILLVVAGLYSWSRTNPIPSPEKKSVKAAQRLDDRPKKGFTVWGIQPGDRFDEVSKRFPQGTKIDFKYNHQAESLMSLNQERSLRAPSAVISTDDDRQLLVVLRQADGKEIISELRVRPVNSSMSVEWDGQAVLSGQATTADILRTFGDEARTGEGNGEFRIAKGNSELILESFTDYGIGGLILSSTDVTQSQ